MIYFYSGTPGSGKSLQVAKDIVQKLTVRKQNVIANIDINLDSINKNIFGKKRKMGKFFYLNNKYLTPDFLYKYAYKYHEKGKEGQTLLVIDEAQMIFSPTVVKLKTQEDKNYRVGWLDFFTQHRHLGYNIIIISQFDRLIDAQIRCLFEYNVIHRKVNNFKIGAIMSIFKVSVFVAVHYWYGVNEKMNAQFYMYHKKYSRIYDSYKKFDEIKKLQAS
ncbi:MAG: zonular occludens toxin domain-containing protein [Solirubrobacterales bacterium]